MYFAQADKLIKMQYWNGKKYYTLSHYDLNLSDISFSGLYFSVNFLNNIALVVNICFMHTFTYVKVE